MKNSMKLQAFLAFAAAASSLHSENLSGENEQTVSNPTSACGALMELNRGDDGDLSGDTTSYVGSSTGPGPNGGYAATPRGAYKVEPPRFFYKDREN